MGKLSKRKPKPERRAATGNAAKSQKPEVSRARFLRSVLILVFLVLIVTILAGWGSWLWKQVGPSVRASQEYQLDPRSIEVHPDPPNWIRADIRAEVLKAAGWDEPLSMLDEQLPQRIADAFEFHPWVERAKVSLRYPAVAEVELSYRRPVARLLIENQNGEEQIVLDAAGYRLPELELTAKELARLPVVADLAGLHLPLVGQQLDEPRLRGATEIAGVLSEEAVEVGIERIIPIPVLQGEGSARHQAYQLQSANGRTYVWGAAPSEAPQAEASAAEKKIRLKTAMKHSQEHENRADTTVDLRVAPTGGPSE